MQKHTLGEIFEIDLMDDADARRHDFERVERLHAPFQKLVALAIALEFDFEIVCIASAVPAKSTCTEWSTTRSTGTSGSMIFGFLPSRCHRGAHGRQIHQQRHAGEILQHNARDDERNFLRARFVRLPIRQGADVAFSVTFLPSQFRSTDSSTRRMETGSLETGPTPAFSSAGRE